MLTLTDYAPADVLLRDAWISCLLWPAGDPKIVNVFREDTGSKWMPPANRLEAMIDSASGAEEAFLKEFLTWFNETI